MDYFLVRACEVARLDHEQLLQLQVHERNIRRCLYPHEIQVALSLPPLKEHFEIPEDDAAQSKHSQALIKACRLAGLIPEKAYITWDLNVTDVEKVHEFDEKARIAHDRLAYDPMYRGTESKRKRRVSDDFVAANV